MTHDQLDRPMRRRREREGKPVSSVRIINLRKPKHIGSGDHTETDRVYTHRWIVEAHWRNQAYGPRHTLRKPILIAPHVKGPEDAPLIVKDKVRVI